MKSDRNMLCRKFAAGASLRAWALVLVVMTIALPACRKTTVTIDPVPATLPVASIQVIRSIPLPNELSGAAIALRPADQLEKANWPLDHIVASLPSPPSLPSSSPASLSTQPSTAPASASTDPPIEVQRAYAAARLAYLEGQGFKSIESLTHWLSPTTAPADMTPRDLAQIQRAIAQAYQSQGNPTRAAIFYRHALSFDPTDRESYFWIGRWHFEQNDWDSLIAVYARALTQTSDVDSSQTILMRHLLSTALERQGYDRAAIEQRELYLKQAQGLSKTSRFGRELFLIQRQSGELWMTLGDACHRLGQNTWALDAYRQAKPLLDESLRLTWSWRWVYTSLGLNRTDDAAQTLLEQLDADASDHAIALWRYALANGLPAKKVLPDLRHLYQTTNRSERLALLLAEVESPWNAGELLADHLTAKPQAWRVYRNLLQRYLQADRSNDDRRAAWLTVRQIIALPHAAIAHTQTLLDTAKAAHAMNRLPSAIESLLKNACGADRAALLYLQAATSLAHGQQNVGQELEQAISLWPDFAAPRIQLAQWATDRREFARAEEALSPLIDSDQYDVIAARVRLLGLCDRQLLANLYLQAKLAKYPDRIDLIQLRFQQMLGSQAQAQAQEFLLKAIDRLPQAESLYESLFMLYDQNRLPNAAQARGQLIQLAARNIPSAKTTRLQLTKECLRLGDWDRAQQLLRLILSQDPSDAQAIELACLVMVRQGRQPEAERFLQQHLAETPGDPAILAIAPSFYFGIGQKAKALEYALKSAGNEPPGPQRSFRLAAIYLEMDPPGTPQAIALLTPELAQYLKNPKAHLPLLTKAYEQANRSADIDAIFRQAIEWNPDQRDDLTFEWAMSLERQQQSDRSASLLEEVLVRSPKHAFSANGIAYRLAVQNRDLDRAESLIRMALQTDANNAAYLDTLGWVLYRKGDFTQALEFLQKAVTATNGTHPVIVGHLGDVLDRLGKNEQAMRCWKMAIESITPAMLEQDSELRELAPIWKQRLQTSPAPSGPLPLPPSASTQPPN